MKSTIWSALMVVTVCLTELAHAQAGETPDILHAGSGQITWTNINPAQYYTVEWRHSLTTGEWSSVYSWFRDIQSQDGVISREIPAFFQIRAHDTPEYLHYLTATSSVVQAGYYAATNLTLVEPNLTAANIRGGATIFGIQGVVLPSTGDATPTHVLDGRTFSNTEASGATGTMPNHGAQNVTPGTTAQTILLGYHDGTGEVAGDADLAAANIKTGVNIFGVDGAVVESTGDAGVGQVLAGATFSKAGEAGLTGTMADQGALGFMPGTADVPIPAGYYSGAGVVTGDAALVTGNIRGGVTLFGVDGKPAVVDTEGATALASDLMEGKVAFVAGSAVTGTIATVTLSDTTTVVQAGYIAATNLALVDADLAVGNIRSGVNLFGLDGTVLQATGDADAADVLTGRSFSRADAVDIAGTMPNRGAQNVTPGTAAQAILQGYHDGTGEVAGDADLAAGNIKAGVNIFGVDGNVVESTGDAVFGQVLAGATFSKVGEAGLTGTMPDQAGRSFMPGTADVPIPAGYYSGAGVVTGDAALVTGNIRGGVTLFGVAGKPEVVDTEDATAVAADLMDGKVAFVAGNAVTGTIATVTLSDTTTVVQTGYIAATNLALVDADLAAGNIRGGVTLFGVDGTVLQATGDATAAEVLTGRTFSRVDAVDVSGTMPNRGAQNVTPGTTAQTILQGYHDGTGEVAGDADLTVGNIKAGVSIFGVDGTVVESTGDAGIGQVLEGATFSKAGEAGLTGTMADIGQQNVTPGTAAQTITQGYHDGTGEVAGDAALVTGNIRAGATIFGVAGKTEVVDTEDGTAVAADVMEGKVAFVAGNAVTGTIATVMLSDTTTVVQAGYIAATNLALVDADLAAGNIRDGVTLFGVPGTVLQATGDATAADVLTGRSFSRADAVDVSGTMPNIGQQTITPGTAAQTITQGYHDGTGEVAGDINLVAANIPYGVAIFGIQGTGNPKAGMALIPAGDFVKTDHPDFSNWTTNYISAFYLSRTHITKAQWDAVRSWASTNGYDDLPVGEGKGVDHPVQTVSWYDVVKWCNARSEMEGRPPAYYTNGTHAAAAVYRTGDLDLTNACVAWTTGGYRLPTESEWEKAARGGLYAHRFPWGHTTNRISHAQANFRNDGGEAYQYGTTGFHPAYTNGAQPYTSPVGSFAPNGYGLYDMSGNVQGWCWDRHVFAGDYYVAGSDLRGPDTGPYRVVRGGGWFFYANRCRSAIRFGYLPDHASNIYGFRVALPSAVAP